MVDQPADVSTARAETDSLLDRGHRPRRLSRKQTRHSGRAATRNAAKFYEELPRSRDAQARAVNKTLLLGAALAPPLASRRLVHYSVSPTRLPARVVTTRQRTTSAADLARYRRARVVLDVSADRRRTKLYHQHVAQRASQLELLNDQLAWQGRRWTGHLSREQRVLRCRQQLKRGVRGNWRHCCRIHGRTRLQSGTSLVSRASQKCEQKLSALSKTARRARDDRYADETCGRADIHGNVRANR